MILVLCAIIFIDTKILVTQRSKIMKLPLKWEFPGGKLEENESEIDCIKREIKEELTIEIEILTKLSSCNYDYGTFKIKLIPYLANYVSGDIQLSEHNDFRLLDKSELLNLDWAQADIPVVKEFLKLSL